MLTRGIQITRNWKRFQTLLMLSILTTVLIFRVPYDAALTRHLPPTDGELICDDDIKLTGWDHRMRTENRNKPRDIDIAKAVKKELEKFPTEVRDPFLGDLERLSWGLDPVLKVKPLSSAGKGVMELIINGSPAYRVVYTLQLKGKLVVLAARIKTCEGQDDTLVDVAVKRRKGYK